MVNLSNLGGLLSKRGSNNMNTMEIHHSVQMYKARVRRDHKSSLVRAAFSLYAWFWFNTEFWIRNREMRRPYTFIMRDWIYPNMGWFIAICVAYLAGLITWISLSLINVRIVQGLVCLVIAIFSSMLWAHLCWGGGWKKGEQEWPPYMG